MSCQCHLCQARCSISITPGMEHFVKSQMSGQYDLLESEMSGQYVSLDIPCCPLTGMFAVVTLEHLLKTTTSHRLDTVTMVTMPSNFRERMIRLVQTVLL